MELCHIHGKHTDRLTNTVKTTSYGLYNLAMWLLHPVKYQGIETRSCTKEIANLHKYYSWGGKYTLNSQVMREAQPVTF